MGQPQRSNGPSDPPPPQIPKILLHQVEGVVKPATLTALMGPSGAGKTTMMDVLAGRKTRMWVEPWIKCDCATTPPQRDPAPGTGTWVSLCCVGG